MISPQGAFPLWQQPGYGKKKKNFLEFGASLTLVWATQSPVSGPPLGLAAKLLVPRPSARILLYLGNSTSIWYSGSGDSQRQLSQRQLSH